MKYLAGLNGIELKYMLKYCDRICDKVIPIGYVGFVGFNLTFEVHIFNLLYQV